MQQNPALIVSLPTLKLPILGFLKMKNCKFLIKQKIKQTVLELTNNLLSAPKNGLCEHREKT